MYVIVNAAYSVSLPCTWSAAYCTCGSFARQRVSTRYQTTVSGETLALYRQLVYCTVSVIIMKTVVIKNKISSFN